jgi:hypothetical protein
MKRTIVPAELSAGSKTKQQLDKTKIELLEQQLRDNYAEQKRLISEINASKAKPTKKTLDPNIFLKTESVPKCLKDFLEIDTEPKTRCEVLQLFYTYCEENNMIDKHKKNIIDLTPEIKEMFGMAKDETMTMFNIQSYFRRLYEKPPPKIKVIAKKTRVLNV